MTYAKVWPPIAQPGRAAGPTVVDLQFTGSLNVTAMGDYAKHSPRLTRRCKRFNDFLLHLVAITASVSLPPNPAALRVSGVRVWLDQDPRATRDSYPRENTNEAYTLSWEAKNGTAFVDVHADTYFGANYGLESLAHMVHAGAGRAQWATGQVLKDAPRYAHRGLLVDTGRRFWPIPLLETTVRAMAAVKMNVLHLHFTDNGRFAVQSEMYPELRPGDGRMYSKKEVRALIEYAADRGVRVVPEVDLPGHAHGMANLTCVDWATSDRVQLADTPRTREFVRNILTEMSKLFVDLSFHIGADETAGNPADLVAFAYRVLFDLGRRGVGWEESLPGVNLNATVAETITLQLWKSVPADMQLAPPGKGMRVIQSIYNNYYLDINPAPGKFWADPAKVRPGKKWGLTTYPMTDTPNEIVGIEVAMWTDYYCDIHDGWNPKGKTPSAHHLFNQERDSDFGYAMHRMIWPKAAIAAGAAWNFVESVDIHAQHYVPRLVHYLAIHGTRPCANTHRCKCSEKLCDCPSYSLPQSCTIFAY